MGMTDGRVEPSVMCCVGEGYTLYAGIPDTSLVCPVEGWFKMNDPCLRPKRVTDNQNK